MSGWAVLLLPMATASSGPSDGTPAADPASVGYTVINLREPDYLKVKPQLDAITGLSYPSQVRNLPPTRDFARAILAQVDPVAAPLMKGTDGWSVVIVDSTGGVLETLEDHPAVLGQRVTLILDSAVQQAAEAAIADQDKPAMLVALQPSTGEIIAVAQDVLGRRVPCLYGGSVNPENCAELMACPHIDGLFIGRSAWQVEGYLDILARCAATIGDSK